MHRHATVILIFQAIVVAIIALFSSIGFVRSEITTPSRCPGTPCV